MTRIITTSDAVTLAMWGAPAAQCQPDGCWHGIYPDPSGPVERVCPYTGVVRRGWLARVMTGREPVSLDDDGVGIRVLAESWVRDSIGDYITGRDARRLRERLYSRIV